MSRPRWFRSRSGLTRCPGCQSHVRIDAEHRECDLCSTRLAPPRNASAGRLGARGTLLATSLWAAGMLGAPLEAAADEPTAADEMDAQSPEEGVGDTPQPMYGDPGPPESDVFDPEADAVAQPIYGTVGSTDDAIDPSADDAPHWTVTVDPLTTALGFVHLQVEYAVAERWSIYAGPHLRLVSSPLTAEDGEVDDLKGYGGELGVRYFLWGDAPEGVWMMMRGVGGYGTTGDESGFVGYLSHLVGYTWIWDGWLVLAGGAGVQYLTYQVDGQGPDRGMAPALHTNLGFAF